jgi:DNA-binding NarL/FixJ family response regulator
MTIVSTGLPRQSKVFIVDDHPLMRDGLRARIQADASLAVCGEAADAPEALAYLETASADLVIIDLGLKSMHGLDLLKAIRSRHPHTRMLVVSAYDESLYGESALRAGAQGYIHKQEVQETVIEAIHSVLEGRRYMSQQMTERLLCTAVSTSATSDDPGSCLSDRELEVFTLIGQGKPTGEIARQLQVSVHTIESYRENIRRKLQLSNGSELMRRAVQWELENH